MLQSHINKSKRRGCSRQSRRGVALWAAALSLAILMPIFSITLVFWAQERADRQAAALAHVLRELGKGYEAALVSGVIDPATVNDGSASVLSDEEVTRVMASPDMPDYISLAATRDISFEFLVGRQDDGPVEGVVVLNAITQRGSLIITRLKNRGLHVTGHGSQSSVSGNSSVVDVFLADSGAAAINESRFGFSSADFAELSPSRVIRQDRRIAYQTTTVMDAALDMGGNEAVSIDGLEATTFTATVAAPDSSGLHVENATLQSLQVSQAEVGPTFADGVNATGSITAASADVVGTVRTANASALDHTTFDRINVTSLLSGPNFIASTLSFTRSGAFDYTRDSWQLISSRATNFRASVSLVVQRAFSEAAQVDAFTVGTRCRGC